MNATDQRFAPGLLLVAALMFCQTTAHALVIALSPNAQFAPVGTTIRIDVVAREFMPGVSSPISSFDFSFRFDPTALRSTIEALPTSTVFGTALGDPGHESTAIWGVFEDTAIDIVRVAEFSNLSQAALVQLQDTESFLLASLYFEILSAGDARIDFAATFPAFETSGGAVVTGSPIPAPNTALLLILGVVILTCNLRRQVRNLSFAGEYPSRLRFTGDRRNAPLSAGNPRCIASGRIWRGR